MILWIVPRVDRGKCGIHSAKQRGEQELFGERMRLCGWGGEKEGRVSAVEGVGGCFGCSEAQPLREFLRTWLGLKVRTRRAEISISWPVWGFRPMRDFFSRTMKLPKPETLSLSPCSRVSLTVLNTRSTSSAESFLEKPTVSYTSSMRSALVIVFFSMACSFRFGLR